MKILGIESTCDETSAAIVVDGRKILSNVVASSSQMHKKYGGIVPEVAAREQIKVIIPVVESALSGETVRDMDAIAVAYGPGLLGSLLIGVETAKMLSVIFEKPLIGVNHLYGHIYANWISRDPVPELPAVGLVISGGHTDLVLIKEHGKFSWIGGTRDDSVGEAFDKVARVLDLGYPGGPEIESAAKGFSGKVSVGFSAPMISSADFDFSFSGIKTSVVNLVKVRDPSKISNSEIAYAFQDAVCRVLVKKTFAAAQKFGVNSIVVGGGVAANSYLRKLMQAKVESEKFRIFFPQKSLSIDNGAMIGAAAFYEKNFVDPLKISADPSLHFD